MKDNLHLLQGDLVGLVDPVVQEDHYFLGVQDVHYLLGNLGDLRGRFSIAFKSNNL